MGWDVLCLNFGEAALQGDRESSSTRFSPDTLPASEVKGHNVDYTGEGPGWQMRSGSTPCRTRRAVANCAESLNTENRQMYFPNFDSERFQHPTFELQSHMVTLGEDVDWS